MKKIFWVLLVFISGGQLLAQAEAITEAKVKKWLKEKQVAFYGERTRDPSIQNLLALYTKLDGAGLLCPSPAAPSQKLALRAERTSEETVLLNWEASTQQPVEGYSLERSFQKEGPYEQVYYLTHTDAVGPVHTYRFTDRNVYTGQSYYRVVQVLATGKPNEQKAVAAGYTAVLSVQAYPNPSAEAFRLSVQSKQDALVQLRVVDVLGRVVETMNNLRANQVVQIGESYQPGIYLVQLVQGPRTKQLMLQKAGKNGY